MIGQNQRRSVASPNPLFTVIREYKADLEQFAVLLGFITALFAMVALFSASFNPWLYALAIISLSLVVFVVKRLIAMLFEVRLKSKNWTTGIALSIVFTLFLSSTGTPVMIPILNTHEYSRAKTLRGLKKGEVNLHEKWDIAVFSSMAFLAFSMLFFWMNSAYSLLPFFAAGAFLVTYVFINFIPYHKFDGAHLAYHNAPISMIFLLLSLLTLVLSYVSFLAGLGSFIAFVIFGFVSYRLKLW